MIVLVVSASLLALFLTLACFSGIITKEKIKKKQIDWISGKTRYLDEELEKSFFQRYIYPAMQKMQKEMSKPQKTNKKVSVSNQRLENELRLAGIRMSAQEFSALRMAATFGILICGLVVAFSLPLDLEVQVLIVLGAAFGAILAPRYIVKSRIKSRQTAVQNQLPSVMDMLSVCIEAGLGFDAALLRITERMQGPLVDELALVYREVQMGKSRREALSSLGQRTSVEELKTFTSAVIQSEQFGTPIKNVLLVQSQQLRISRRQHAQEKGMKAPVKMMLPMVIFIFPVIFIILLGPTVINFIQSGGFGIFG